MPRFIACYDLNNVNSPHATFLEAARPHGWVPWILSAKDEWNRLPNTTLFGEFDTMDEAVAAFKAIKPDAEKELGAKINVEKWIVVNYSNATFISDEKVPNT